MNSFIRLLYALLIAASVVVFIGVGIVSFYGPPKSPEYPRVTYANNGVTSEQDKRAQDTYEADSKAYSGKQKSYQRNVTYIALPLAAITLASGLYLMRKPGVIGEGIALGGILTTAYGVITASIAGSSPLRFVAVTLLLIGALMIGHLRFGNGTKFGYGHAKFLGKVSSK